MIRSLTAVFNSSVVLRYRVRISAYRFSAFSYSLQFSNRASSLLLTGGSPGRWGEVISLGGGARRVASARVSSSIRDSSLLIRSQSRWTRVTSLMTCFSIEVIWICDCWTLSFARAMLPVVALIDGQVNAQGHRSATVAGSGCVNQSVGTVEEVGSRQTVGLRRARLASACCFPRR